MRKVSFPGLLNKTKSDKELKGLNEMFRILIALRQQILLRDKYEKED